MWQKPPLQNSISLSYVHRMLRLKQENVFRQLDIEFLKTWSLVSLSHCLTIFTSLDALCSHNFTAQQQTRWAFWGSNECGASAPCCSFYLLLGSFSPSFSKTKNFFTQHFPWAVCLDATTLILNCLYYSRRHRYDTSSARHEQKARWNGHGSTDIYAPWWQSFCPWVFSLISTD